MNGAESAARAFVRRWGRQPEGVWCAPARVNLIGEHTDYNGGLALAVTVDRHVHVAAAARPDRRVSLASAQRDGTVHADLDATLDGTELGWAAHVAGALAALARADPGLRGADILADSDVPAGAGLGSSAALAVAACLAVTELSGRRLPLLDVARACNWGEVAVAGAPTGFLDQYAVLAGAEGVAVLIDFAGLTHRRVPFDLEAAGAALLVVDTNVAHDNRGGGYRARREDCAAAASALGLETLSEATPADLTRLDGVLLRRTRHVVTENERVDTAVALLEAGRVDAFGPLLHAGHVSLRDDFEVSCPELDCAVAAAESAGAWGARLTGAGFGGSAFALAPARSVLEVAAAVLEAARAARFPRPDVQQVNTAAGARRCA